VKDGSSERVSALIFQAFDTSVRTVGEISSAISGLVDETGLRWWFRGLQSTRYDLVPSGKRGYSPRQEQYFYNEFYCRAGTRYGRCPDEADVAGWLSLMQHYRLPTRLLDWSFSPLIGAYFATEGTTDAAEDACIWALAPSVLNESQGFEPLLYPLSANSLRPLLEPAKKGVDSSDRIVAAMAVEADPRMQMQQGAFTVHASMTPLNLLEGADRWLRRFVVPADGVSALRQELRLLGYRADYLFPDLEALAEELRLLIRPGRH
jgi:hypothetical protein